MPTTTDIADSAHATEALEAAKLEALYQFAYGLSHEINNPLANIATRAQTLLLDEKDPERRRKLATINQQAFRAHEMIADLMLFARPPALRLEETDLAALADTIVAELQDQAREQGTRLTRTGEPGPLLATIDPTQIAVALRAIIQNALEAVRTGGSVTVNAECGMRNAEYDVSPPPDPPLSTQYSVLSTQPIPSPHFTPRTPNPEPRTPTAPTPQSAIRNPQFLLTVTDTGPGIPPHIRPHIFDPFFCGREAGRGLGLGLSKAWRIINLHGGQLEVESPAEGGARFVMAIPGRSPT
ncbi:MAG TPA: ATP-binding protein [Pirellulaceae bacterium]|nr:ATP-binding protein [Pirellulaceae bacterium]